MEQAMEWEIMDYTFYPYYWGNRAEWQQMYVSENSHLKYNNTFNKFRLDSKRTLVHCEF